MKNFDDMTIDEKKELKKESDTIIAELKKTKANEYYTDALFEIHNLKKEINDQEETIRFKSFLVGVVSLIGFIIFCELLRVGL